MYEFIITKMEKHQLVSREDIQYAIKYSLYLFFVIENQTKIEIK